MSINELIVRLERCQGRDRFAGQEKRKHVRLLYPPNRRPVFKVGKHQLEVVDISVGGLKLFNYMQHKLDPDIRGMVAFIGGASYEVNGKITWQFENTLGLVSNKIPLFIIEEEVEYLLQYFQEQELRGY